MIIGIDCGHSLNSSDYGASGIKEESNLTREVGNKVIELFTNKGHQVINCTVDFCDSLNDSLYRRYNKANMNNCDYFISIHFNAFNGSAHGTEILYYSDIDDKMERILSNFVSLGFTNRGLKQRTNLAVLKNTNMKAMLIECCFCDSAEDMNIYNVDSFSKAIVEGFLDETLSVGQTINVTSNESIAIPMASKSVSPAQLSPIQKAKEFVGSRCLELQEKLNKAFGCGLSEDNDFGQLTYISLGIAQTSLGITCDYLAGDKTFSALDNYIASKNVVTTTPQSNSYNWIAKLQSECNAQGLSNQKVDGYSGQNSLNGCPTLKVGSQGNITKLLQEKLGISNDGVFGNDTLSSVIAYQNANGLGADGIVGRNTWRKLLGL